MDFELGAIIAERTFGAINESGTESQLRVRLGTPNRIQGSVDVYAPYQVLYGEKVRSWYAAGVDGFQALQLAMKMIAVELDCLRRDYRIEIRWHGDKDTGLNF
jgi:hypothetical protein